ncbi:hypothetical protein D3C83_16920 [compost metagenome]
MDDRNRAAPIALAGNAPVAQPVEHLFLAEAACLEIGGDGVYRVVVIEAVIATRIHACAMVEVGGF